VGVAVLPGTETGEGKYRDVAAFDKVGWCAKGKKGFSDIF
jgi:hypothetical protein